MSLPKSQYINAGGDNAMTEIALALAMAFFSIMVLSMVSMGVASTERDALQAKKLAKLAAASTPAEEGGSPREAEIAELERLVIFDGTKFMDGNFRPLAVESLPDNGQIFLAVVPDLPISDAITAQSRLGGVGVTITTLDEHWINSLKAAENDKE